MKVKALSFVFVSALLLSACVDDTPPNHAGSTDEHTSAVSQSAPHWSYEGHDGPAHWGTLDPTNATCSTGTSQSPIDLTRATAQDVANPSFHYQPSGIRLLNNGHTVQVNYDAGSYMEASGQRYEVLQYHYHAPSEHAVDGNLFDAELHIVHKDSSGQLAVVGILLEEGAENAAFAPFLGALPAQEGPEQRVDATVNAAGFLPAERTTFRYSGSLTTPPCSEGVSWFVMATPVQLSAGQMARLKDVFEGNNRPVQPLHARTLSRDAMP